MGRKHANKTHKRNAGTTTKATPVKVKTELADDPIEIASPNNTQASNKGGLPSTAAAAPDVAAVAAAPPPAAPPAPPQTFKRGTPVNDAFGFLSKGARFDKRRYSDDVQMFKNTFVGSTWLDPDTARAPKSASAAYPTVVPVPPSHVPKPPEDQSGSTAAAGDSEKDAGEKTEKDGEEEEDEDEEGGKLPMKRGAASKDAGMEKQAKRPKKAAKAENKKGAAKVKPEDQEEEEASNSDYNDADDEDAGEDAYDVQSLPRGEGKAEKAEAADPHLPETIPIIKPGASDSAPALFSSVPVMSHTPQMVKQAYEDVKPLSSVEPHIQAIFDANEITVQGVNIPDPVSTFEDVVDRYNLPKSVLININTSGWLSPLPIQMVCLPLLLESREVMGIAPTGSGKTAAFVLPILNRLKEHKNGGIRAVILAPTKELAQQTYRVIKELSRGIPFRTCVLTRIDPTKNDNVDANFDILVSAPLKLVQLIQFRAVNLNKVEFLILDEADRLFSDQYIHHVDKIIAACQGLISARRESSGENKKVQEMCHTVMSDPVFVMVGKPNTPTLNVDQKLLFVGSERGKLLAIQEFLVKGIPPPVLIFVQTKERAVELAKELSFFGVRSDAMHDSRSPQEKDEVLDRFRQGKIWMLVTTDVLARGKAEFIILHSTYMVKKPNISHRIGRTGRANRQGRAITFYTEDEVAAVAAVAGSMRQAGCVVPDWLVELGGEYVDTPAMRIRGSISMQEPAVVKVPTRELRGRGGRGGTDREERGGRGRGRGRRGDVSGVIIGGDAVANKTDPERGDRVILGAEGVSRKEEGQPNEGEATTAASEEQVQLTEEPEELAQGEGEEA
ncbi:ATP-dependent RNA helicase DDX52/ROK1 [Pelomyxa schiedti]|nr:ATP-dependent RNA helicase DDX52/ROK1 [Pelomyxa schiedti]